MVAVSQSKYYAFKCEECSNLKQCLQKRLERLDAWRLSYSVKEWEKDRAEVLSVLASIG